MNEFLTKPYEISLWEDDPSLGEVKICTIGTHTMEGQNRAFEPIFSRNVNGVKKLSFKIYKKYVDIQTSEKVDNPYMSYLFSERKVKLYLPEEPDDNKWHDFIIKNVSEDSSTHLCTYQLEDALVQELAKNGFGMTLDAQLMNNIGTANELAKYVLRETDWSVSDNSEAFVQTIDEALVYLTFPQNPATDLKVYKITGQKEDNRKIGIIPNELDNLDDLKGKTILAFYSSCTGKPHRFQFLYSENGVYNTEEELKNYISNETDYQYYIDFDNPEDDYSVLVQDFSLPVGFNTTTVDNSVLCTDYRGRRYGFSPQAKYIPVLDRYVQLYKKGDQEYYGYEHAEYKSPALTQNMISNSTFESTSGWTGTKSGTGGKKATVEAVYGYFNGSTFISAIDELKNGTFKPDDNDYKAYLKLIFFEPVKDDEGKITSQSTVINSGPFDNRTLIGNMVAGDEWALWSKVIGPGTLNFTLGEYKYSSTIDGYDDISGEISFSDAIKTETKGDKTYSIYTVETSTSSNESFKKKSNVRLQISASKPGEYYLEAIELFKVARYNNTIIPLEEQANSLEDRTVEKTYYYFTDDALDGITNADQLEPEATAKTLSYATYKPVYNEGAQKIRTITAKESNYFNILQSIAETFEAWLTFDIVRNNDGGIISKKITFKNYVGGDNYACFRYGVNLKDIQRTFESKNIVTKLIVKNNSNEHADGGFCTIQRANANPTGENYIYDFQYFFNQGLMDSRQYLDTLYIIDGAKGPDYKLWPNTDNTGYLIQRDTKDNIINLKGYFPRIKALNNKIQAESELLANIAQDLTKYKADLAVAEAGLDAATSGIEEVREDFLLLTGTPIDMLSTKYITEIDVGEEQTTEELAKEEGGWYYTSKDWLKSVSIAVEDTKDEKTKQTKKQIKATITIKDDETLNSDKDLYIKFYPTITLEKGEGEKKQTATVVQYYNIKCSIPEGSTGSVEVDTDEEITIGDFTNNSGAQKKLQEYAVYVTNENKYASEAPVLQEKVDALEAQYNTKQNYIEKNLKEWKRQLNQLFFQTYSRFIQEGTWISEEYIDDGLYYADAQSVMYNSCYPQVAYTINVISVEGLPDYEDFKYKLGEKTWVVDPDFFETEEKEPVIITEIVENLDDRSKNQIKVQNFKNQFQDLFQKITATVQQARYSTGSYEKAVALAEANQEKKNQFLSDALDSANSKFFVGKQPSVRLSNEGLIIENPDSPCNAIKMVGGAIMLSKQDENGQQKWVTGVTSDGVSASLITAGVLNAGEISIMNYDEPVFRWDTFGISAYDATWYNGGTDTGTVISGVNTKKFVRFDKHGIYGINDAGIDGANWHPQDNNEIDEKSTFALTWEGLKVTGNEGVVAKLGKEDNYIMKVTKAGEAEPTFSIDMNGNVHIAGVLNVVVGSNIAGWQVGENSLITINKTLGSAGSFHMYSAEHGVVGTISNKTISGTTSFSNPGWMLGVGANFGVTSNGDLYAKNATLSGGNIAGWKIGENSITADDGDVGLFSSDTSESSVRFGAGKDWQTAKDRLVEYDINIMNDSTSPYNSFLLSDDDRTYIEYDEAVIKNYQERYTNINTAIKQTKISRSSTSKNKTWNYYPPFNTTTLNQGIYATYSKGHTYYYADWSPNETRTAQQWRDTLIDNFVTNRIGGIINVDYFTNLGDTEAATRRLYTIVDITTSEEDKYYTVNYDLKPYTESVYGNMQFEIRQRIYGEGDELYSDWQVIFSDGMMHLSYKQIRFSFVTVSISNGTKSAVNFQDSGTITINREKELIFNEESIFSQQMLNYSEDLLFNYDSSNINNLITTFDKVKLNISDFEQDSKYFDFKLIDSSITIQNKDLTIEHEIVSNGEGTKKFKFKIKWTEEINYEYQWELWTVSNATDYDFITYRDAWTSQGETGVNSSISFLITENYSQTFSTISGTLKNELVYTDINQANWLFKTRLVKDNNVYLEILPPEQRHTPKICNILFDLSLRIQQGIVYPYRFSVDNNGSVITANGDFSGNLTTNNLCLDFQLEDIKKDSNNQCLIKISKASLTWEEYIIYSIISLDNYKIDEQQLNIGIMPLQKWKELSSFI